MIIRTFKIYKGFIYKTIKSEGLVNIRLPISTPKGMAVTLGDAQAIINNLGDLRIK